MTELCVHVHVAEADSFILTDISGRAFRERGQVLYLCSDVIVNRWE